ncbi:MAG: serine--tRNA ligase [Chloroflexi bacterium]|nr:serine--tRNA ligase [Chloroflexota bacterium]
MLDIRLLRDEPDLVRQAMIDLNAEDAPIEDAISLDKRRRQILVEVEALKAERNTGSKQIGLLMREGKREEADNQKIRMGEFGKQIAALESELRQVESDLEWAMLNIPNLPLPDVPVGKDEEENVVTRTVGEIPSFDFDPKPHWEIGENLGILDFERGVKLSGSRFYLLKGLGARLQRVLIAWMLDVHIEQHGYTEVLPPQVVREHCLVGAGNLPKFGDNLYRDIEDDLWLIPTAEVPVTNMYRHEILDAEQLPLKHVAFSSCFRREKMSAGKDTRGIKRGHQFDKVEMVKWTTPENGRAELDSLVDNAEDICRMLEIPYRVVQMCTGDLSFVAAIKFDLEMWAPGCQEWLEVSSCSMFTDFQARRANIRYRPEAKAKPRYVYTLNGSGLALPRVVIAVLENYQQPDGSIVVPEVLRPYMRTDIIR